MKIWNFVPTDGPGITASGVMNRCADPDAELWDIQEALRWAERDGKVKRLGCYYWRTCGQ